MPFVTPSAVITSTAQINDGVIVDSDVNAAAAIAASKLQTYSAGVNGGPIPAAGIDNTHVAAAAAIAFSKLAALSRGGVLVGGASNVPTVLAPGSAGQVLQSNGNAADPTWATVSASKKQAATATQTTIVSSTAETTIASASIGAGVLGTAGMIRIRVPMTLFSFQNTKTCIFRLKYGSTTIATLTMTNSMGSSFGGIGHGEMEAWLLANGSTSAQVGVIRVAVDCNNNGIIPANTGRGFVHVRGTAAEDSTGALTLSVTAQFNTSSVEDTLVTGLTLFELIQ